jgi:hypothetical protein
MMTNTVSNTAFRGFGGPQGMLGGERMIEEVAYALGRDPLEIRKANFYGGPGRERHALSPDGGRQHHRPDRRGAGNLVGLSGAAGRDHRLQRQQPGDPARHRADAGQVRHLVHRDLVQSGRCAGACLPRRLDPSQSWRHRDGPGAQHQGCAGAGRRIPGRSRHDPDHRHHHRQGAQHIRHRRLLGHRPQRHGGSQRGAADQGPAGGLRIGEIQRAARTGGVRFPTMCGSATS